MKKTMMTAACLMLSFAASAQSLDTEVFLAPYVESMLKEVSGKVVLDAGSGLAPRADVALYERFNELSKGLQIGEKVMVAAPASYDVVFTSGTASQEAAHQHINQVLASVGRNNDPEMINKALSSLVEVMRATFLQTNKGLMLVMNEKGLQSGQQIWCKTPEGVVSTVYNSEEDYLKALSVAGFKCEEIKRPCFFGKVKYDQWHAQQQDGKSLGSSYITHHPFTLFYVVKQI